MVYNTLNQFSRSLLVLNYLHYHLLLLREIGFIWLGRETIEKNVA